MKLTGESFSLHLMMLNVTPRSWAQPAQPSQAATGHTAAHLHRVDSDVKGYSFRSRASNEGSFEALFHFIVTIVPMFQPLAIQGPGI